MTVWATHGEHPYILGDHLSIHVSEASANIEAAELVNMIRKALVMRTAEYDVAHIPPATPDNWEQVRDALAKWSEDNGPMDWDVYVYPQTVLDRESDGLTQTEGEKQW